MAEHVTGIGTSMIGSERVRLANQGSARKSIATLIEKLQATRAGAERVAVAEKLVPASPTLCHGTDAMRFLLALPLVAVVACSASAESTGEGSQDVVESIRSMVQRPDGRFDVTCVDGRAEIVTAEQIRRNEVCGAPTTPVVTTVTYACDSSANLQVSVLAADGGETTTSVTIGSFSTCNNTVRSLGETRREITRPTIAGACDSSANLQRFGILPEGRLVTMPATAIGSFSSCNSAASATNARLAPASVPAANIDYTCDSSANLQLVALASTGAVTTGTVAIGSFSTCSSSARSLLATRSDVQRTVALGACDSSANLQRFSATPTAGLKQLAATAIGSFSTCTQQANALNR